MKAKLMKMMEDLQGDQGSEPTPNRTDLTIYFDNESEVCRRSITERWLQPSFSNPHFPASLQMRSLLQASTKLGERLNATFMMIVLTEAHTAGIELEPVLIQMLDDHARRQVKLELADSTISSAYEMITVGGSRAGTIVSSVMMNSTMQGTHSWPGYGASSPLASPPSTTAGLREEMAIVGEMYNASGDMAAVRIVREDAGGKDSLAGTVASQQQHSVLVMKTAKPMYGAASPNPSEDLPTGNAYEELTHPPAPSTRLLAVLDGKRPATQRSRLPAPSAAGALNMHLMLIGAEVDADQPFEIFGEQIEEDMVEPIIDKVIKERHEEVNRHEKWQGATRDRWMDHLHDQRLLLNDRPMESAKDCMTNEVRLHSPLTHPASLQPTLLPT